MASPTLGGVETPSHGAAVAAQGTARGKQRGGSKKLVASSTNAPGGGNLQDPVTAVKVTQPDPNVDPWTQQDPSIKLVHDDFQVWTLRAGFGLDQIDPLVEELDWEDGSQDRPVMVGSLQLRDAAYAPRLFNLRTGDFIILKARDTDGKFKEWWRQRIITPQVDYLSGTRTFELASDLHRLYDSTAEWKYGTGRDHPKGWLGHEVIVDVCQKYGIAIGSIPAFKVRITNYGPKVDTPINVIVMVLNKERAQTGTRYTISYEYNQLVIRTFQRSAQLLQLGRLLTQAGLTMTINEDFATSMLMRSVAVDVKTKDKKGHTKKLARALHGTVQDSAGVQQYGLITRMGYVSVASQGELVNLGKQHLAIVLNPTKTVSASHPGVIGLRRFDAVKINILNGSADADIKQVVYVDDVQFSLAGGAFDMSLTLALDDPYTIDPVDPVADQISEVAATRGRVAASKKAATKDTSARAAQRSSANSATPATLGGVATPAR